MKESVEDGAVQLGCGIAKCIGSCQQRHQPRGGAIGSRSQAEEKGSAVHLQAEQEEKQAFNIRLDQVIQYQTHIWSHCTH